VVFIGLGICRNQLLCDKTLRRLSRAQFGAVDSFEHNIACNALDGVDNRLDRNDSATLFAYRIGNAIEYRCRSKRTRCIVNQYNVDIDIEHCKRMCNRLLAAFATGNHINLDARIAREVFNRETRFVEQFGRSRDD
jgi:hypothetical protein